MLPGIEVVSEVAVTVMYGEIEVEVGYRIDMLLPRELDRCSHQGRHQAHGQSIMCGSVVFFFALFAVNLVSHQPRKHHAEGEPHRSRQVRGRHPDSQ